MQILLHKRSLYSFAFLLVNLLFAVSTFGQTTPTTKIWDGGANTSNWNDGANWKPDGVPDASHDVEINNENVIINISNAQCASLTYGGGNRNTTLTISNSKSLSVTGLVTINAPTGQTTTKTIAVEDGSLICGSIKMTNGGNGSRDCQLLISTGSVTVSGNITMEGRESRNYILFSGAGTLNIGGNITGGELTTTTNSTVNYNGAAQTVYSTSYYNLILSGSGIKTMTGVSTINGNFTMSGYASATAAIAMNIRGNVTLNENATFNASSFSHTIGGDWINNNVNFNAGTSTVNFNGSSAQSIKGTTPTTFNNLTINNTSNIINSTGVLLGQDVNVSGFLNLVRGQVTTSNDNVLTLNDNASITGGSSVSYVDGPMKKVGNDAFTFPLGENGKYGPITISAPGNITDVFSAEYFPTSAAALGATNSPNLNSVNGCEYWDLSGNSSINVTLYYNTNSSCNGQYITDPSTVVIAHFDDVTRTWNSYGGTVDITNGTVTWSGVTDFSYYTYGLAFIDGILPVHFSNVRAAERSNGIQVEFTNLTESDVAYYEVERSFDGKAFSAVKRITPSKNNYGSAAYNYLDATAKEGRFTYRIKAVETTGKTIYSSLINISLGAKNTSLSVYAKSGQVALQVSSLPAGKYLLQLFNAAGQLLGTETLNHGGGSLSQTTSLNSAKSGIYILNINGSMRMQQKFLVQ